MKQTQRQEIETKKRIAEAEKVRKQQMQYKKRHKKTAQIIGNKPRPTWKVQTRLYDCPSSTEEEE